MTNLIKKENNNFLTILGSQSYPVQLQEQLNNVLQIVKENKSIVDLYPKILSEVPISSSCFQDQCVQFEEHHTPHRKLRQCMLELQSRLDALDSAKNGYKKSFNKKEKLEQEIERLEEMLRQLTDDTKASLSLSFYFYLCIYIKDLDKEFIKRGIENKDIEIFNLVKTHSIPEVESLLIEKKVSLDEVNRGLKSSEHMVKDAALKVCQHQELIKKYQKEVEETGWSFEVSEMVYYVMYFTTEIEKQLITMNRVDTGTFGVIKSLPEGIRKKVLWNMNFLEQKIKSNDKQDDYLTITYRDILLPKVEGDSVENTDIKDFIGITPINILSKKEEE